MRMTMRMRDEERMLPGLDTEYSIALGPGKLDRGGTLDVNFRSAWLALLSARKGVKGLAMVWYAYST